MPYPAHPKTLSFSKGWGAAGKCLHEFLLGTLGAEDVGAVGDEALAHQGALAHGADEAVVVPVAVFKRDEPCAANACWIKENKISAN